MDATGIPDVCEPSSRELRAADFDKLEPVRSTSSVDEACNWKVSVENYSECYHCRLNHPTFASGVIQAGDL